MTPITIFICFLITSSIVTLNPKLQDVLNNWKCRFGKLGWTCLWLKQYAMPSHTTHSQEKHRSEYLEILSLIPLWGLPLNGNNKKTGSPYNGNFLRIMVHLSQFDLLLAEHSAKEGSAKRSNPSSLSLCAREKGTKGVASKALVVIAQRLKLMKYFLSGLIPHVSFLIFDLLMVIATMLVSKVRFVKKKVISLPIEPFFRNFVQIYVISHGDKCLILAKST